MLRTLVALFLTGILISPVYADRCGGISEAEAKSANGRYKLTAKFLDDGKGWQAKLEDTETKRVKEGSLGKQSIHPHIEILITDDGSRIIIFEPRASDREKQCIQVYDRDFKLVKEFDLKDLLTNKEREAIRKSTSHYTFTSKDSEKGVTSWLEDGGKSFVFHAISGRRISILLDPIAVKP